MPSTCSSFVRPSLGRDWVFLGGAALAILLTGGCATSKVDWESRVGRAQYDEVVREMGPADKTATLSDGSMVVEWLEERGATYADMSPGYYHARPHFWGEYWTGRPTVDVTQTPDRWVRLTFGPDKVLRSWKRVSR